MDGLDSKLFEGLPQPIQAEDVIEVYGTEGSGKTQILIHLIANCILPKTWEGAVLGGRGIGVVLVDTDYHFSLVRLVEVLEQRISSYFSKHKLPVITVAAQQTFIKSCLSRLIVSKCNSSEELIATIQNFDNIFCNRPDICVMMIDSVSAFYWLDKSNGGGRYYEQDKHQRRLVDLLKRYIENYYIVVIATKPAIFSKDGKQTKLKQHYEYMCRDWQEFVKYRCAVSRPADASSTFLFKVIKPSAGDCAVRFSIHKEGLMFLDGACE